jgi:hypothetical protein
MFYPRPGGSVIEVADNAFGFIYKCQVPPTGWGKNVMTGKMEEVGILKRSDIPEEMYWERPALPGDYQAKRRREAAIQKTDPRYTDPYLEKIRRREWQRRLCGVWFWNFNPKLGKPELLYITGQHYLYATYWKFQGKFNDFRITDRDYWYVQAYCAEDPDCLGLNEMTKRKQGKTARAGCWLYERTSRMPNHHGGIQSKADDDAEEVFKKAVIHPWQKLPHFFRPNYDVNKGDNPGDALMFFKPSKRGEGALDEDQIDSGKNYLESFVDFKSSADAAYDGPEVHSMLNDETSKTKKPASIKERQSVLRFCTEIDGVMKGKHTFTTTVEVEKDKNGNEEGDNWEFQELTANSNPLERDENNRTITGLYTYFLPAHKGMMYDRYGYADEEKATVFLLNQRKALQEKGDTRGLSSFKRKNPMSFKEAFQVDGENALFDPELLNEQLEEIIWRHDLTERGDLEWRDGQPFEREVTLPDGTKDYVINQVLWKPNDKGKFQKPMGWWPEKPNAVYKNNGAFLPNNNFAFRGGYDPFKYDKTKDKRRSNAAGYFYQMPDPIFPSKWDNYFVLRYSFRQNSRRKANMDILMMAWLCGCQVLVERNAGDHYKEHYTEWGCFGFLMWLPGEVEPGITTDGGGKVTQRICELWEQYINEHIKKILYKPLLVKETGLMGFKVEDTQKFDEPMAGGICLIAVHGKKYTRPQEHAKNIEDVMPMRRAG